MIYIYKLSIFLFFTTTVANLPEKAGMYSAKMLLNLSEGLSVKCLAPGAADITKCEQWLPSIETVHFAPAQISNIPSSGWSTSTVQKSSEINLLTSSSSFKMIRFIPVCPLLI